ncbi:hypothetical protein [Flagellimonas lutaonensis]|uniref:Uncharacterized protein n=1 Tax=Flagellimonas lutaonensis TaxID=516051 RepID=A0A0D5YSM0_9FLAO|nr:hypothetical protein [Allomuricauda lutaonensis]AKA34904.1 hypothetical protein VC82_1274 [Allomuricauda lutaonensis]
MDFQILPNWFKKIGLMLFVIASLLTAGDSFMDGLRGTPSGTHHYLKDLYGENLYSILYILPTLGLLIYMFSKEKIEDDYIKLIRLKSYQITITIFLLIAFVVHIFDPSIKFKVEVVLSLFMCLFLLIFYFNKNQEL